MLCGSSVLSGVYGGGRTDPGPGDRRDHRNFHFDPCRDAASRCRFLILQLYRVGDGDDCCVEGGPQDRWGMFSFPFTSG